MSHAAHISLDVGSRLAQGGAVFHGLVQGIADGIEQDREERLDAVQRLAVEYRRSRRRAAVAEAELARARQEIAALRLANAGIALQASQSAERAAHAEDYARRLVDAVHRDRAARAAAQAAA